MHLQCSKRLPSHKIHIYFSKLTTKEINLPTIMKQTREPKMANLKHTRMTMLGQNDAFRFRFFSLQRHHKLIIAQLIDRKWKKIRAFQLSKPNLQSLYKDRALANWYSKPRASEAKC